MPPLTTNACVTSQLRQLIYYHIDNHLLSNALFFAERLAVFEPKLSDSAYLVSLCHLRLGDNAAAYEYSRLAATSGKHLGCAYVFAQACLLLEKFKEGISVLERCRCFWSGKNNFGKHSQFSRQPIPDGAAVACLLGKLYYGFDNKQSAASCYEEALKLNPFMWDAFTNLCDMGTVVRVPNIFRMTPELEAILKISPVDHLEPQLSSQSRDSDHTNTLDQDRSRLARPVPSGTAVPDPFNNVPPRGLTGGLFSTVGVPQKLSESNPSLTNLPATGGGTSVPPIIETPTGPGAIDITLIPSRRDPGIISAYSAEPPQAPVRKGRTLHGLGMDYSMDAPKMSRPITSKRSQKPTEPVEESAATQALRNANLAPAVGERKRTVSGQVVPRQISEEPGPGNRRSIRLFNQIRPTSSKASTSLINPPTVGAAPGREVKKARPPISRTTRPTSSISTVGRQVSGNRKPADDFMDVDQKEAPRWNPGPAQPSILSQRSSEPEPSKQEEAIRLLLDLCKKFGSGYFALSQFQSQEALERYAALPRQHQDTPWVMAQMGRAHYEQAAYAEAEKYYKRIRQVAPSRFEDMEIYSTILWHLKRETDLAFLAHELIDSNWKSPQAWCALGNSWSLARDHEQALRCFKRATQLNPKFAYGFTLQGHEHVANEEYDKALQSYRHGIAADKRHYNAWYGVGRVYEKLGTYEKAFSHFTSASLINPTNAVLTTCIGTVFEKQKQPRQALTYYTRATELAPKSALIRYKKARALMSIGDMTSAMEELMILKDMAPDAAMVHFELGRLYKSIRDKGAAVKHFTIALNLDPKVYHIFVLVMANR